MTVDLFANPQHAYTRELIESDPPERAVPAGVDAEPALVTHDLKVHFPIQRGLLRRTKGYVRAVDGVSFTLRRGRTIGVVGESGSGKSTLAMALLRLIASDGGIQFRQRDLRQVGRRELRSLRRQMQIVFQDPFASLSPRMTALQIIEEGLRVHEKELDQHARRQRVAAVMSEVGLDADMVDRYPHEFSGGQPPAYRHRQSCCPRAGLPHSRRADERPRPHRAASDSRAARHLAAPARSRLPCSSVTICVSCEPWRTS